MVNELTLTRGRKASTQDKSRVTNNMSTDFDIGYSDILLFNNYRHGYCLAREQNFEKRCIIYGERGFMRRKTRKKEATSI